MVIRRLRQRAAVPAPAEGDVIDDVEVDLSALEVK
jgi:hypothetical protein